MRIQFILLGLVFGQLSWGLPEPIAPQVPFHTDVEGVVLSDPYHWMRTLMGAEPSKTLLEYVAEENHYSKNEFRKIQNLKKKLIAEFKTHSYESIDFEVPLRYKNYEYTAGEDGATFTRIDLVSKKSETLIQASEVLPGIKNVSIDWWEVSPDQNKAVVEMSYGSQSRFFILDIQDKKHTEFKWGGDASTQTLAWAADSHSFVYVMNSELNNFGKVYIHQISSVSEKNDQIIFENNDDHAYLQLSKTRDEKYISIQVSAYSHNETFLISTADPNSKPISFVEKSDLTFTTVEHADGQFIVKTNLGKNYYNIYTLQDQALSTNELQFSSLQLRVEGSVDRDISDIEVFKNRIFIMRRYRSNPVLEIYDLNFKKLGEFAPSDAHCNLYLVEGQGYDSEKIWIMKHSMIAPEVLYSYTDKEGVKLDRQAHVKYFDAEKYVFKKTFYRSYDGTEVPMTLLYKKSDQPLRDRPVYYSAYGSYGSNYHLNYDHGFNLSFELSLLNRGFVIAIAHIRGGGENGLNWFLSGRRELKKNSFDDFESGAEFLIDQKITTPQLLAIQGYSAGGLVMGHALNNRPELFKVAVINMGFLDFVNTELDAEIPLTTIEWELWGNPNHKADLEYMLKYSPYDNVSAGVNYPALLVNSAFDDQEVLFPESVKYVAKMRAVRTSHEPVLLNVIARGKGTHDGTIDHHEIDEAQNFAFILNQLGIEN